MTAHLIYFSFLHGLFYRAAVVVFQYNWSLTISSVCITVCIEKLLLNNNTEGSNLIESAREVVSLTPTLGSVSGYLVKPLHQIFSLTVRF